MTDLDRTVEFLQKLIRTEGLPGEEEETAGIVRAEMEALGFDEVWVDDAGSVVGLVRGRERHPSVMFNTHLDHVDVGDPSRWPHPPFGGELAEGRVWGRGAVDIKGPLAAQVEAVGRLAAAAEPPPTDVYVSAVVQEEIGGLGARHMSEELAPDLVVIGEPSSNQLRRGHRGRTELTVHVTGRSVHASVPETGVNPLYALAGFLERLPGVELPEHPELGVTTVAPTLIRTDQRSHNVVPGEVWLTLDIRTGPETTPEILLGLLEPILQEAVEAVPGSSGEILVPAKEHTSWKGVVRVIPAVNPSWIRSENDAAVVTAGNVLEAALGERPPLGVWHFATDGGHFAAHGSTVVGIGPGEEGLAHTVRESIELSQLETALDIYEALAREWPTAWEHARS
jgi:succinyl-diaminopimelate desuccinylase